MRTRASRHRPANGLTLIEVLLASVLAAALLSVLWTLLSMHARVFDAGQTKTEQSQLARTLLKQLSDDLHNVVQAPPPAPPTTIPSGSPMIAAPTATSSPASAGAPANASPGSAPTGNLAPSGPSSAQPPASLPPSIPQRPSVASAPSAPSNSAAPSPASPPNSGAASSAAGGMPNPSATPAGQNSVTVTSSLRPAGLLGTETSLQLDVLQPTTVREEVEADNRRLPAAAPSRVGELRTVYYVFEEGLERNRALAETRTALVRREVDWEDAHPAGSRANRPPGPASSAAMSTGTSGALAPPMPASDLANDPASERAPEVVRFAMRYFDGSRWSSEWDSGARKGLPVAVEVAMQLRAFDEPEPNHHPANDASAEDAKTKQPKLPIYRLLIHLPSATRQPGGLPGPLGDSGLRGGKPLLEADPHGSRR